ncbi:hypothetical protein [Paraburkholderia bannensis]|uniref:hypothetical protein n=1 Tax=Paraburkholderia bannensis TaxID=765414 RepID=UPI002AB699EF|nr:hypothetical protein [Paraburkholderia bannensis]
MPEELTDAEGELGLAGALQGVGQCSAGGVDRARCATSAESALPRPLPGPLNGAALQHVPVL